MATSRPVGDWNKALRLLRRCNGLAIANMTHATKRNARGLRDEIRFTLRVGRSEWPPNSPATIAAKGSSKPLRDYGDLAMAPTDVVVDAHTFFVGIARGQKTRDAQDLVNIATIHEFGGTIKPKTAKMLAIPVSREARALALRYGAVRNIPDLFIPKGSRVLARKAGDGFEVLFALKTQVVIPPRSFIETSYREFLPTMKSNYMHAARMTLQGRRVSG